jgi:hypothetical protein
VVVAVVVVLDGSAEELEELGVLVAVAVAASVAFGQA